MNTPQVITEDHPSFRHIAVATLVVTIIVAFIVIVVGYEASTAADNSGQVAQGNEIASCRSAARAATIDASISDSLLLVIDGLAATFRNDAALRAEVDAKIDGLRGRIVAANEEYQERTRLAVDDPAAFLAECKGRR